MDDGYSYYISLDEVEKTKFFINHERFNYNNYDEFSESLNLFNESEYFSDYYAKNNIDFDIMIRKLKRCDEENIKISSLDHLSLIMYYHDHGTMDKNDYFLK